MNDRAAVSPSSMRPKTPRDIAIAHSEEATSAGSFVDPTSFEIVPGPFEGLAEEPSSLSREHPELH
jgi:hypothetical protein